MSSEYRALMRRKLLEEMYDRLSREEKQQFVILTMQDKSHDEIMDALRTIDKKADQNHHSFMMDFGANVAGNAVWDLAVRFVSMLLKRLR